MYIKKGRKQARGSVGPKAAWDSSRPGGELRDRMSAVQRSISALSFFRRDGD